MCWCCVYFSISSPYLIVLEEFLFLNKSGVPCLSRRAIRWSYGGRSWAYVLGDLDQPCWRSEVGIMLMVFDRSPPGVKMLKSAAADFCRCFSLRIGIQFKDTTFCLSQCRSSLFSRNFKVWTYEQMAKRFKHNPLCEWTFYVMLLVVWLVAKHGKTIKTTS